MKQKGQHRKRQLTHLQTKLVKELPTSASVSEAGRKAGYACRQDSHRALAAIREKMPEVLDRVGLTQERVADKCLQLMSAKKTEFYQNAGIVVDQREVEALDIQTRATEMAARMHGAFDRNLKVELNGAIQHSIDLGTLPDAALLGVVELAEERPAGGGEGESRALSPTSADLVAR